MSQEKENKKLYRSNKDKIIAGVCGGLGEYFDVDSLLIRLIFILSALFGGSGILVYLLLWLFIPKSPKEEAVLDKDKLEGVKDSLKEGAENLKKGLRQKEKMKKRRTFFAWFLIVLGVVFVVNRLAIPGVVKAIISWPIILIFIGVFLLVREK